MNLFFAKFLTNFFSSFSAAKLGVKKLLPAYLDPNLQLQDLLTGVSFASGGAGYDPLTAELVVHNHIFNLVHAIYQLIIYFGTS